MDDKLTELWSKFGQLAAKEKLMITQFQSAQKQADWQLQQLRTQMGEIYKQIKDGGTQDNIPGKLPATT